MSDQLRTIFGSGRRHLVTITFVALLVVLTAYYFLRAGAISSKQALIDEKSKSIRKLTTTVKNAVDIEKHTERLKIINNAIDTAALKDGELAANQQQMQAMQLQLQMEQMSYMQKSFSRFVAKTIQITAPEGTSMI
jgi:uncharacterized protein YhaN